MVIARIQIFSLFKGKWNFFRTLSDRSTGASLGSVQGKVTFTTIKPNVVLYKEEGKLTTPLGDKLQTYREYLYQYYAEKDEIEKRHVKNGKDTGSFYLLKFQSDSTTNATAISAVGEHLCVRDHYSAGYQFVTANTFSLRYEVRGPEKDYISETTFNKIT